MKLALIILGCMILFAGCAHLEVPPGITYPFRAEFEGSGMIGGMKMHITGALYLSSINTGIMEVYGPSGLTAYNIDLKGDKLVLKDTWGNKIDEITLPLCDIAGLFAGDVPRGAYMYKEKTSSGTMVSYVWGSLLVDEKTLPQELRVRSNPALNAKFTPRGKFVLIDALHGPDNIQIKLTVRQGGRWLSS